jgi:hypothetical protein
MNELYFIVSGEDNSFELIGYQLDNNKFLGRIKVGYNEIIDLTAVIINN